MKSWPSCRKIPISAVLFVFKTSLLSAGMLVSFEGDPTDVLPQVKVPELSSQAPDPKTVDVASMYEDIKWRKITRAFLLNGWKGHG